MICVVTLFISQIESLLAGANDTIMMGADTCIDDVSNSDGCVGNNVEKENNDIEMILSQVAELKFSQADEQKEMKSLEGLVHSLRGHFCRHRYQSEEQNDDSDSDCDGNLNRGIFAQSQSEDECMHMLTMLLSMLGCVGDHSRNHRPRFQSAYRIILLDLFMMMICDETDKSSTCTGAVDFNKDGNENNGSITHLDIVVFLALFHLDFHETHTCTCHLRDSKPQNTHQQHTYTHNNGKTQTSSEGLKKTKQSKRKSKKSPKCASTSTAPFLSDSFKDSCRNCTPLVTHFMVLIQIHPLMNNPSKIRTKTPSIDVKQMNQCTFLMSRLFPLILASLEELISSTNTSSSPLQSTIISAAMNLAIFILSSPLRVFGLEKNCDDYGDCHDSIRNDVKDECNMVEITHQTQQYILGLYPILSRSQQQTFMNMLLELPEIIFTSGCLDIRKSMDRPYSVQFPPYLQSKWDKNYGINENGKDGKQSMHKERRRNESNSIDFTPAPLEYIKANVVINSLSIIISIIKHFRILDGLEIVHYRLERFSRQPWYLHCRGGNAAPSAERSQGDTDGDTDATSNGNNCSDDDSHDDSHDDKIGSSDRVGDISETDIDDSFWKDMECVMMEFYCVALIKYMQVDIDDEVKSNNHVDNLANTYPGSNLSSSTRRSENEYRQIRLRGLDVMELIQRLVYSFWDLDPCERINMVNRDGSVVLGLMLSRQWVHSNLSDSQDCDMVLVWVLRLLKGDIDCIDDDTSESTSVDIDAVTGYWALMFVYSLCPELDDHPILHHMNMCSLSLRDIDKIGAPLQEYSRRYTRPIHEVFNYVKMFTVAKLGLLYLATTKESKVTSNYANIVLGYSDVPEFFGEEMKGKKKRILRVASLVQEIRRKGGFSTDGDGIVEWFKFLNLLLDIYFKLVYVISGPKWNPGTWITASIELFQAINDSDDVVPINLGERKVSCNDASNLHSDQLNDDHSDEDISFESLLDCTRAYFIAIAFVQAILKNAHHFYYTDETVQKKDATIKLVQFQLAKLYDLDDRCNEILNQIQASLGIRHNRIRGALSRCFLSSYFVSYELMNDSISTLSKDIHKNSLDALFNTLGENAASFEEKCNQRSLEIAVNGVRQGLKLHTCTLQNIKHLNESHHQVQIRHEETAYKLSSPLLSNAGARALFRCTKMMILWIPLCKRYTLSDESLNGTMGFSDRFVITHLADLIQTFVTISLSIVELKMEKNLATGNWHKNTTFICDNAKATECNNESLHDFVRSDLCSADFLVAAQLFDLVFLLLREGGNKYISNSWIRKYTLQFMYKDFSDDNILTSTRLMRTIEPLPRVFLHCIECTLKSKSSVQGTIEKIMLSMVRIAVESSQESEANTLLTHSLLIHWGFSVKTNVIILCEDFDALINDLGLAIESANDESNLKSWKRCRKDNEERRFLRASLEATYATFYNVLFHLVITTLAMHGITKSHQHIRTSALQREVQHNSIAIIKCFGNLLKVFAPKFKHFPKDIVASTTKGCLLVITLCENILHSHAKDETSYFSGHHRTATRPLKKLVDEIKLHCRDRISKFCSFVMDSSTKNSLRDNHRTISNLAAKIKKMDKVLAFIESNYNLCPSSLMGLPALLDGKSNDPGGDTVITTNQRNHRIEALNTATQFTNAEPDSDKIILPPKSGDDDDDSFGVLGDWGESDE